MEHNEVGELWDSNAEAWTALVRAGYDVYRDHLNTPAFIQLLPEVNGLPGLDIGCGEGHNTRQLAKLGAKMTGIDISASFISDAEASEAKDPLGIQYKLASAVHLPFNDEQFEFATAFMSFMDMPETKKVLEEAYRVIAPGGFLQFSISHPCFSTPHRRNLRGNNGATYAIEVGDYFTNLDGQIEEWTFGAAPQALKDKYPKFRVPRFTLTISQWINLLINVGFTIEKLNEPQPSEDAVREFPSLQDASVAAYFLQIRVRK